MKTRAPRKIARSFHSPASPHLLETLETRVLLSAALEQGLTDALAKHIIAGTSNPTAIAVINGMLPVYVPGATNLHATITWDDGTVSEASFLHGYYGAYSDGAIGIMAGSTPATVGEHVAHVHYYQLGLDGTTVIDSLDFDATVTVDRNSATGVDVDATAGKNFSGSLGTFEKLDVPDGYDGPMDGASILYYPDADTTNEVKVIIDWGDGTSSGATVTRIDGGYNFDISGEHRYAAAGTYRITVHATVQTISYTGPEFPGGLDRVFDLGTFYSTANVAEGEFIMFSTESTPDAVGIAALAFQPFAQPAASPANAADGATFTLVAVDDPATALAAAASNVAPGYKFSPDAALYGQAAAPLPDAPVTSVKLSTADKTIDEESTFIPAS